MCYIKNDDFFCLILFVWNFKYEIGIFFTFKNIICKKVFEIMFNYKEDKLIKYNFVSREVKIFG